MKQIRERLASGDGTEIVDGYDAAMKMPTSHQVVFALSLVAVGLSSACAEPDEGAAMNQALQIIAHRGASGYLPEHTLEAYALAHGQGADFVEPDLVMTLDGAFVCLHDLYLEPTTNVAEVFPERARDDGRWYAADFTLAEIRGLEVHERLPNRFPIGRSSFRVPTFEEMIELVQGLNQSRGMSTGIYPELKAPRWHSENGLPMAESFLEVLRRYDYDSGEAPIFVQAFEPEILIELGELGSRARRVMLLGGAAHDALTTAEGLEKVRTFADGIGPAKERLQGDPTLVVRAHAAGLLVHPYTFRVDQVLEGYASFDAELDYFVDELGIDGLFTDFPDQARFWQKSR